MRNAFQQEWSRRELDYRASDGVEVRLTWSPATASLTVSVTDSKTGDAFELAAQHAEALDVFHHPYAHAAFRGIEFHLPSQAGEAAGSECGASAPSPPA